jgi:hypothetical protein
MVVIFISDAFSRLERFASSNMARLVPPRVRGSPYHSLGVSQRTRWHRVSNARSGNWYRAARIV